MTAGIAQPCTSRYKCMSEFMRPQTLIANGQGGYMQGASPGKTNCVLKKGHDGPHENVRGEHPGGTPAAVTMPPILDSGHVEVLAKKLFEEMKKLEAKGGTDATK